ncbi:MAG: hypothetical protein RML94_16300 [Bacteroidia bacterium]|nr:hypothetical protein [Bacteroidia bacterium]
MGVSLHSVSLRSCVQGRRATGYAIASVLRCASHRANARPPHASRRSIQFLISILSPIVILCSVILFF